MNKVITINLGGNAYQLEEGGYDALRVYLETAATRLAGNPDQEEILLDIEWAIAEKFRGLLGNHKNVVANREVSAVLAAMGPIEAEPGKTENPATSATPSGSRTSGAGTGPSGTAGTAGPGPTGRSGATPKRLYRISEDAMIAGVCNGMAAYLQVDPTLVRLAFVFLTFLWGSGLAVYVVLAIVVPEARSPEEKAAATGAPSTAQEFIRRAREGYYEAIKGFPDRQARRAWQRRFKREMRVNAHQWRSQWQHYWAEQATRHPGIGLALPVISLLQGAFNVIWICALVSLLATGAVLGVALPVNVPVWVGALLLLILYAAVAGPIKMARRACYWSIGQLKPGWSLWFLVDGVAGLVVMVALMGLAIHYCPVLREALHNLPTVFHQATEDVQAWWQAQGKESLTLPK